MTSRWTDEWERFGSSDPYYGVCNLEQNRGTVLSVQAAAAFWESGESEIGSIVAFIEERFARPFSPRFALEFGCGVGRLTIPLARRSARVLAVDISPAMIDRARTHVSAAGLANVAFALSDDDLSSVPAGFDFVLSYTVFQHIPPALGYAHLARILDRLAPGGFGALHFTFYRRASLLRKAVHAMRRRSRLANALVNLLQRRPAGAPMMPMFEYERATLLRLLRDAGCGEPYERATDHGGHIGAVLLFRKPSVEHARGP